jgi:hypothetical protein
VLSPDKKNKSKSGTLSSGKQFKAMTGISYVLCGLLFNRFFTTGKSGSDQQKKRGVKPDCVRVTPDNPINARKNQFKTFQKIINLFILL